MGRPSSATATIYKPDGTVLVVSGSATIDSCNTTITATAAAGTSALALTSATGVTVGRYYVLTAADGRKEWVRVVAIESLNVTLAEDLAYD